MSETNQAKNPSAVALGGLGGKSKSAAKVAASKRNQLKAAQARRKTSVVSSVNPVVSE